MFLPQELRPEIKVGVAESIIDATEQVIRSSGWANGNPRRMGCSQTCIGIALAMQARSYDVSYFRVHDLLLQAAQIQTGKRWRDVPEYNDDPARTLDDVWGLFKIARDLARA